MEVSYKYSQIRSLIMSYLPVRPGFQTASPYMILRDVDAALGFYTTVLGAEMISRQSDETGGVRHAEFRLGDSTFMVTSESPQFPDMRSIEACGGSPVHFFLYVTDPDALFAKAVAAGATEAMPVTEQPYGRSGGFKDPFGLTWWVSTHRELGTQRDDETGLP